MILILSPAKTLEFDFTAKQNLTTPEFLAQSKQVMQALKPYTVTQLMELQDISKALAELNFERNKTWTADHNTPHVKPAIFAFKGDVYVGLQAETLTESNLEYAQAHLRILSGLYGVLKPLDGILPYRLEMGTKLKVKSASDLYKFWKQTPAKHLSETAKKAGTSLLLNLASNEYFKAVDTKTLGLRIISPEFKEFKNGEYKIISFFAKKARGEMARFVIENKLTEPQQLEAFDLSGYQFNNALSKTDKPVFTRN